jgi:hypothetical protein
VQQRLTIHVSRTARGEKKMACVVTRIFECFACGVLSSADLKNSYRYSPAQAHRKHTRSKHESFRGAASGWPECIVAHQLPVLLYFAVPYSNEFKRAIDLAILRCSSTNPAFRNAIAPESSDCTPENLARSASCS